MWLTNLMIISCLLVTESHDAQRTPTQTPESLDCIKASRYRAGYLQAEASGASSQRLLVVPRKGSGRSFRRNIEGASLQGGVQIAVEDTYKNIRGITIVTTAKAMLESAKKQVSMLF